MKEFKVGCSPVTSVLYAGNVNKKGIWSKLREDVTESAPLAVAQHLLQLDESISFYYENNKYILQVVKVGASHKQVLSDKDIDKIDIESLNNEPSHGEVNGY